MKITWPNLLAVTALACSSAPPASTPPQNSATTKPITPPEPAAIDKAAPPEAPAAMAGRFEVGEPATYTGNGKGAIKGHVFEAGSDDPLVGVTIVGTSPSLEGTTTAISGEGGEFSLEGLATGKYQLRLYWGSNTQDADSLDVVADQATTLTIYFDATED